MMNRINCQHSAYDEAYFNANNQVFNSLSAIF